MIEHPPYIYINAIWDNYVTITERYNCYEMKGKFNVIYQHLEKAKN